MILFLMILLLAILLLAIRSEESAPDWQTDVTDLQQPAGDRTLEFSVLTPLGRGAIATIAVQGPHLKSLLDRHFRSNSPKQPSTWSANRPWLGRWIWDVGNSTGSTGDPNDPPGAQQEHAEEVVLRFFQPADSGPGSSGPGSSGPKGWQRLEIHCHGGPISVAMVVETLQQWGGVQKDWDWWLAQQADSPAQQLALRMLPQALTRRTALLVLAQSQGAFDRAIQLSVEHLRRSEQSSAQEILQRLLTVASVGFHTVSPFQVALVGRPNVGKSSLLNSLLGYQRAIVFHEPGTTRDLVTALTAFDGWPVELVDTAGLRETDDPLEAAGVRLTTDQTRLADLVLLVLDGSQTLTAEDQALLQQFPQAMVVVNKADLPRVIEPGGRPACVVSAQTGEGLPTLIEAVARQLVSESPQPGQAVPLARWQVDALQNALEAIEEGDAVQAISGLEALSHGSWGSKSSNPGSLGASGLEGQSESPQSKRT